MSIISLLIILYIVFQVYKKRENEVITRFDKVFETKKTCWVFELILSGSLIILYIVTVASS